MKTSYHRKSQRGFFDLGLSLLVLAVAGGSVLFIEQYQAEKPGAQPESNTITVNQSKATTVADLERGKVQLMIARRVATKLQTASSKLDTHPQFDSVYSLRKRT